jgi:hypothetical protein
MDDEEPGLKVSGASFGNAALQAVSMRSGPHWGVSGAFAVLTGAGEWLARLPGQVPVVSVMTGFF